MFLRAIFRRRNPCEYISEVRTEEARQAAENAVTPVYAPPDPSIARGQIERLRAALQYITLVREDENSTPEQKASDIAALSDIKLKPADHRKHSGAASRTLGGDPAGSIERAGAGDAPHHP